MSTVVADIMTANPITIQTDTTLQEMIGLMKTHSFRHLLVVEDSHLIGIVTDRDVRLAMNSPLVQHDRAEDWHLLQSVKAQSCMTPNPMTVEPHTLVAEAADLIKRYKFDALPVVKAAQLVGIVTISDMLTHYIKLLQEV